MVPMKHVPVACLIAARMLRDIKETHTEDRDPLKYGIETGPLTDTERQVLEVELGMIEFPRGTDLYRVDGRMIYRVMDKGAHVSDIVYVVAR